MAKNDYSVSKIIHYLPGLRDGMGLDFKSRVWLCMATSQLISKDSCNISPLQQEAGKADDTIKKPKKNHDVLEILFV